MGRKSFKGNLEICLKADIVPLRLNNGKLWQTGRNTVLFVFFTHIIIQPDV